MKYLKGSVLVILLWYILAAAISGPVVPYPHRAAAHLMFSLVRGEMHLHVFYSLYRIIMGIAVALVFAVPAGMIAGRNRSFDQVISPMLYLLYPLPKIAFLPVFMVLLGIGDLSKIVLLAVIIFFPAAVTIRDGVRDISGKFAELAQAYHLTPAQVISSIILPGVLPRIFSSLRISLGISLSVLFISENYAASYGLGYNIMNYWIMANYIGMYGGIIMLSLLGLGLYIILDFLERLLVPWNRSS